MKGPKIIQVPTIEREWFDIQTFPNQPTTKVPGRSWITPLIIKVPSLKGEDRTWSMLKYGFILEPRVGVKIDEFELDRCIFNGVLPYEQDGDIFTCTVDAFYPAEH